ncbi:unnamed protein product, partial [Amoebophrya sp. A120]
GELHHANGNSKPKAINIDGEITPMGKTFAALRASSPSRRGPAAENGTRTTENHDATQTQKEQLQPDAASSKANTSGRAQDDPTSALHKISSNGDSSPSRRSLEQGSNVYGKIARENKLTEVP